MNIKDIYELNNKKIKLEKELSEINYKLKQDIKNYFLNYFNGEIPKYLPIGKNQFISVDLSKFSIEKGQSGKIYWKTYGTLVSVKDGKVTYGHSYKEVYQGEYEALSLEQKNNTLEKAKEATESIFNIIPQIYDGIEYANYGYELARNEELGLFLVWRKAGTAYIDRSRGSVGAKSSLELIKMKVNTETNYKQIDKIKKRIEDIYLSAESHKLLNNFTKNMSKNMDIAEGGRLSKKVILNHERIIDEIFGLDTAKNIVEKMENKSQVVKEKEPEISSSKVILKEETIQLNNGKKLKF